MREKMRIEVVRAVIDGRLTVAATALGLSELACLYTRNRAVITLNLFVTLGRGRTMSNVKAGGGVLYAGGPRAMKERTASAAGAAE